MTCIVGVQHATFRGCLCHLTLAGQRQFYKFTGNLFWLGGVRGGGASEATVCMIVTLRVHQMIAMYCCCTSKHPHCMQAVCLAVAISTAAVVFIMLRSPYFSTKYHCNFSTFAAASYLHPSHRAHRNDPMEEKRNYLDAGYNWRTALLPLRLLRLYYGNILPPFCCISMYVVRKGGYNEPNNV